uniref:Uncharacterized protein n=1 Tax=Arundo donax TaxID=35708 RepID=A0A0A8Y9R4_ARUDO
MSALSPIHSQKMAVIGVT